MWGSGSPSVRDDLRVHITATGSGLFMALVNILPSWVVLLGRDLILALSGGSSSEELAP